MLRNLDIGLSQANRQLVAMAGLVEEAIIAATHAWRQRSTARIQEVYAIEQRVNQAHIEVDSECVKLLALQQPMATDLRQIISLIKINTDLERMVDLAVNIAQNTEYFLKSPPVISTEDLSDMSDEVRVMVREALDAFVQKDERLARSVLLRDDKVDQYKRKIFDDVLAAMRRDPACIEQGLNVILIAKNLERVGDHATNVGEDVIYMSSGKDVRHSGGASPGVTRR